MERQYGKIKNGKLIKASDIILRNGSVSVFNESLYSEKGYKRIVYNTPPNNKDGFELICSWEEEDDTIVQKWDYRKIPDDYSADMLVAVRKFCNGCDELCGMLSDDYNSNSKQLKAIFKKEKIINLIYSNKKESMNTENLLYILHQSSLNLKLFFDKLGLKKVLEDNNYIATEHYIIPLPDMIDKMKVEGDETKIIKFLSSYDKDIQKKAMLSMQIKPILSKIYALESFNTTNNRIMYDMCFIYMFTMFDEVLLKMIYLVCMYQKEWLISNSKILASEILKCNTVDELHTLLANKKIKELSWNSYEEKLAFLNEKGIVVDDNHKELFKETITFISCKRNVLVHNNGEWNEETKMKLNHTKYFDEITIGKSVDRSLAGFKDSIDNIIEAVKYLYEQICDKFDYLFIYDFENKK